MCGQGACAYRGIYGSFPDCLGIKTFFLQDVFGHDYSCIYLLTTSAEMKSYQLLPSINQMGTFPKTLGFWSPFKPAAVMAFLWLADCCLCCAGSLMCLGVGLWKGICSRFCVFEGVSGSGSLLAVRPVSPFVWSISSPSGVVSCHNLWCYLAAFPHIPLPFFFFSYLTTGSSLSISSFLPMCMTLKNNLMREVGLL